MDVVDAKLIPLQATIKKLTTDSKLGKKLHDDYKYKARKPSNGLTLTNSKTKHYQVDAKQFYDWVKQKFPDLKANIPEEYRLTAYECVITVQSALNAYAPAPKFSTLDEAKQIIQEQADEIRDLKNREVLNKKKCEQALAELKIKVDKWDHWIETKGHPHFK